MSLHGIAHTLKDVIAILETKRRGSMPRLIRKPSSDIDQIGGEDNSGIVDQQPNPT